MREPTRKLSSFYMMGGWRGAVLGFQRAGFLTWSLSASNFNALRSRSNANKKELTRSILVCHSPLCLPIKILDPPSQFCREVPINIPVDPPALTICHFHFSIFQLSLSPLESILTKV